MNRSQELSSRILFNLEKVNGVKTTTEFKSLQHWQAQRLLETHRDLYEQDRFKPAMNFFKNDLYSSDHFLKRNRQLIRALPLMTKTLPESVLEIVADAAELHRLSLEMDALLLHHLLVRHRLDTLTLAAWVEAYRLSDNKSDRVRQIELIESLGNELQRAVKIPMVKSLLAWAKIPARMAGYQDIHEFICTGFAAFEQLEHPDDFLIPIIEKERQLMELWFRGGAVEATE